MKELKIGDIVGYVDPVPNVCALPVGDPQWRVLLTAPNSEAMALAGLVARGFRAYGPTIYRRVRTGRRDAKGGHELREVSRAMFPGYIFIDLRTSVHDFLRPLTVPGARSYLQFNGGLCILPAGLVEAIIDRERVELQRYQESIRKKQRAPFTAGEKVRVSAGPFCGFFAAVESLDDHGRVAVLLSIFGRETPAWLNGEQLEAV